MGLQSLLNEVDDPSNVRLSYDLLDCINPTCCMSRPHGGNQDQPGHDDHKR